MGGGREILAIYVTLKKNIGRFKIELFNKIWPLILMAISWIVFNWLYQWMVCNTATVNIAQTFFSTFRTNEHRPQFCEPGCLPILKPCPTGEQCIPLNSGKTG